MKEKLLDPKVDFVFKRIFGSEKHPNILISFLNSVLGTKGTKKEIVKVKIDNAEINREWEEDKLSRLDVKATADDGRKLNVEIQLKNQYNMKRRTLYYWSKLYTSQLNKGEKYSQLRKTVAINILNFNYLKSMEDYHNCFLLKEKENNQVLTDIEEIHFIELTKLNEEKYQDLKKINDDLIPWLLFLKDPESEVVKMIEEKVEELKEAAENLEIMSQDKEERQKYEARQKAIHDYLTNLEGAKQEGVKLGERGRNIEIAKEMIEDGEELEKIMKYSKLSKEEIKGLQKS
ncbi:Rpn family recombination-promoting nuclease/putative transposase [Halanaerobacter jeridensis]|uniref:Transposase/invertase (TIGR01784 family) n=1 Tax=Halanaerobacter jeridensis TaxID=706427 RepID=A0A938XTG0_9FIRM|nr:putative transposase/invertase (TIGR01784 family) [Halanaerobacter jeridensis]